MLKKIALRALTIVLRGRARLAKRAADIVILHDAGYDLIKKILPEDKTIQRLPLQGEFILINISILLKWLRDRKKHENDTVAYALAAIHYIKPVLVISFADESEIIPRLVGNCGSTRFLSIQNGTRNLHRDNNTDNQPVKHDNFACFGESVVDQYTSHGATVSKYYPMGSLRRAVFVDQSVDSVKRSKVFDLCLVSEVDERLEIRWPEIFVAVEKLTSFFARYCRETGAKYCIAARNSPGASAKEYRYEEEYFREMFGPEANLIPNEPGSFNSYALADSSRVSVSVFSTLCYENFGCGNRTLFCNFTGQADYDVPQQGLWSLRDCDFTAFSNRLNVLRSIPEVEYSAISGSAASYFMKTNDISSWRKLIKRLLGDGAPS